MQESLNHGLEILCPDHQEKIITFSVTSQPKCQKCLTQQEIPVDQFVKNLEKHRKDKISFLKQSQSDMSKKLMQFKQLLIKNKEHFLQSMNNLIKNIDERLETLKNEFNSEISRLNKPIQSLQMAEVQQYSKEFNQKFSIESQQQQNNEIQNYILTEYDNLQNHTNITQSLEALHKKNSQSSSDSTICVPNLGQVHGGEQVPLCISCPPECCYCKIKIPKYWSHQICGGAFFIESSGDIHCSNGCQSFFIQSAKFKCFENNQLKQFCSPQEIIYQLSKTPLTDQSFFQNEETFVEFWINFTSNLVRKWVK